MTRKKFTRLRKNFRSQWNLLVPKTFVLKTI